MELIKALWRGDVPLVKTYWLFGVAVGLLVNVAFIYIEYQPAAFASAVGHVSVLGLAIFVFIYSAFISVAVWRSANKYQGLQTYVVLAKFAVISGVMGMIRTV